MSHAPWIIVSAGFHEQGGQAKAVAALADHLLVHETPVHLVGHDFASRFRESPHCTIHSVSRPWKADFFGVLALRHHGRTVARRVCSQHPDARVVVNGGNCHWADVNWVHFVHAGCQLGSSNGNWRIRLKETVTGTAFRRQEGLSLRAARVVLANSERTRGEVIREVGVPPERVHTVYYGGEADWRPPTDAERFAARTWLRQDECRPLAVFVGGFGTDERKGFDTLFTAWRELCRDPEWNADLVVAGAGATFTAWQSRVRITGLTERVRLIGFTDRVYDVLAAADLLVSPTRYEPYGLNVQEAVCRGVPALVSACAGVTEQYPTELADMVLPDPNDWQNLAARLRCWRADLTGWRDRFGPLGESLRRYSWTEMAVRIVALAETALELPCSQV